MRQHILSSQDCVFMSHLDNQILEHLFVRLGNEFVRCRPAKQPLCGSFNWLNEDRTGCTHWQPGSSVILHRKWMLLLCDKVVVTGKCRKEWRLFTNLCVIPGKTWCSSDKPKRIKEKRRRAAATVLYIELLYYISIYLICCNILYILSYFVATYSALPRQ